MESVESFYRLNKTKRISHKTVEIHVYWKRNTVFESKSKLNKLSRVAKIVWNDKRIAKWQNKTKQNYWRFTQNYMRTQTTKINNYLNTSSLFLGNGTTVGINGGLLSGLSLTFMTFVAWTSDSTKNECQCVCDRKDCIQKQWHSPN